MKNEEKRREIACALVVVLSEHSPLWDKAVAVALEPSTGADCWRWEGKRVAARKSPQVLVFPIDETRCYVLVNQEQTKRSLPNIAQAFHEKYPFSKTHFAVHGLKEPEAQTITEALKDACAANTVTLHPFSTADGPFMEALEAVVARQKAGKAAAESFDDAVSVLNEGPFCKTARELSRLLPLMLDLHGLAICKNDAAKRRYTKDWAKSGDGGGPSDSLRALWNDVNPFTGTNWDEVARNAKIDVFLADLDEKIKGEDAKGLLECTNRLQKEAATDESKAADGGGYFVITENDHLAGALTRTLHHGYETELARFSWGVPDARQQQEAKDEAGTLTTKGTQGTVEACFERLADQIEARFGHKGRACLAESVGFIDLGKEGATFLDDLNPLTTKGPIYDAVAAMLILAFPEVHWVFVGVHVFRKAARAHAALLKAKAARARAGDALAEAQKAGDTKAQKEAAQSVSDAQQEIEGAVQIAAGMQWGQKIHVVSAAAELEAFMRSRSERLTLLFDPTGLRNALRARANRMLKDVGSTELPLRCELAAALDEEEAYVYFNAYTAYRFGFRSWVVDSWRTMQRVFDGKNNDLKNAAFQTDWSEQNALLVSLIFEDFHLEFPDTPEQNNLFDLNEREKWFPGLSNNKRRIAVTSSHRSGGAPSQDSIWEINRKYYQIKKTQAEKSGDCFYYATMPKPFGGMFALWQRSGLKTQLPSGKGHGYEWPIQGASGTSWGKSHSAPARLLSITRRLTDRAGAILQNALSIPEAIYAATLALEAQEYLKGSTPTTALEALALQHKAEVRAECEFYGVDYNMDVRSRLREMAEVVDEMAKWFAPQTRFLSNRNAQIKIIGELTSVYRNHNQFDEEQICLMETRVLLRQLRYGRTVHRSLGDDVQTRLREDWATVRKTGIDALSLVYSFVAFILFLFYYPIRWYLGSLINSTRVFVLCINAWIVAFTIVFANYCTCHKPDGTPFSFPLPFIGEKSTMWVHGFCDAINTLVALQPPHGLENYDKYPALLLFVLFGIVVGLFHIGIFISHIYTYLTRR